MRGEAASLVLSAVLCLGVDARGEEASACLTPGDAVRILRPLLDAEWWEYTEAQLSEHWPSPLSYAYDCDPRGRPCHVYEDRRGRRACFSRLQVSPSASSDAWTVKRITLLFMAPSASEALRAADLLERELHVGGQFQPVFLVSQGDAWRARAANRLGEWEEGLSHATQQELRGYCWVQSGGPWLATSLMVHRNAIAKSWELRLDFMTDAQPPPTAARNELDR